MGGGEVDGGFAGVDGGFVMEGRVLCCVWVGYFDVGGER